MVSQGYDNTPYLLYTGFLVMISIIYFFSFLIIIYLLLNSE